MSAPARPGDRAAPSVPPAEDDGDRETPRESERGGVSQSVKAVLALRSLLLAGELEPGERISELAMVDRLGVSRTPVRAALARLEEEGLVEAIPGGGYAVKAFSEREVYEAIEIRGVLEGLAARLVAERGVASADLDVLRECVAGIDAAIAAETLTEADFARYVDLNARFHAALGDLAASRTLSRQIERAVALPFASPSAFVHMQATIPGARTILLVGQDQHRCIIEAIERREGARAESLMREHARLAHRNLGLALRQAGALDLVPGAALIRRRAR